MLIRNRNFIIRNRNFLNLVKSIYQKLMANIIVNLKLQKKHHEHQEQGKGAPYYHNYLILH